MIRTIVILLLAPLAVALFHLFGRWVYGYRLGSTSIEILLFNAIPIWRIPYSEVVRVEELSLKQTLKPSLRVLRLGNRIGRVVSVQRRSGVVREVLLTPNNPSVFALELRERVHPR
jgi:hypothetical protein